MDEIGGDDFRMKMEGWPCCADPCDFFAENGAIHKVGTGSAIFLRNRAAKETGITGFTPEGAGNLSCFLPLVMKGDNSALDKLSGRVPKNLVFFREECAFHRFFLLFLFLDAVFPHFASLQRANATKTRSLENQILQRKYHLESLPK